MERLTEAGMLKLLTARYSGDAWAFIPHVRNGTGFARARVRTCDALAMSTWPSRGLHLHGFEIKVDRGDWLKEKKDPAKAEEIARFCDFWWIAAADADLVQLGELPPPWGLLAPRGGKLVCVKEATQLSPQPMDRLMLASILRAIVEGSVPRTSIQQEIESARAAGEKAGRENASYEGKEAKRQLADLTKAVADFAKVSGVDIRSQMWRLECAAKCVKAFTDASASLESFQKFGSSINGAANCLESVVRDLREAEARFNEIKLLPSTEPSLA